MGQLIWLFVGLALHARVPAETRGFVTTSSGHQLWVEHRPALPGRPTLILLNGLTYTTREWDQYVAALDAADPGVGVLRYDMWGMGQSIGRAYENVTLDDQVADLVELPDRVKLTGPLFVQGLSFGGAVALKTAAEHPDRFAAFIAMAPFLNPLPEFDDGIRRMVQRHRLFLPWDLRTSDELYDHYLRVMVFATYPAAEPVVTRNWPVKLEHIYRLVKGARHWLARSIIPRLPRGRVHLMFAEDDEYVSIKDSRAFAAALPTGVIGSVLYMKGVRHKVPEVAARAAARWTLKILAGAPRLNEGLTWRLDAATPSQCDTLLRTAS